jgi:hypothetical protein
MDRPDNPRVWIQKLMEGYALMLKNQQYLPPQASEPMTKVLLIAESIADRAIEHAGTCTDKEFYLVIEQELIKGEQQLMQINMLGKVTVENQANLPTTIAHKWQEAWHGFLACIFSQFPTET